MVSNADAPKFFCPNKFHLTKSKQTIYVYLYRNSHKSYWKRKEAYEKNSKNEFEINANHSLVPKIMCNNSLRFLHAFRSVGSTVHYCGGNSICVYWEVSNCYWYFQQLTSLCRGMNSISILLRWGKAIWRNDGFPFYLVLQIFSKYIALSFFTNR